MLSGYRCRRDRREIVSRILEVLTKFNCGDVLGLLSIGQKCLSSRLVLNNVIFTFGFEMLYALHFMFPSYPFLHCDVESATFCVLRSIDGADVDRP